MKVMTQPVKLLLVLGTLVISGFIGFNIADKNYTPKPYAKEDQNIETYDIKNIGPFRIGMTKSECSSFAIKYIENTSELEPVEGYKTYYIDLIKNEFTQSIYSQIIKAHFYKDTLYSIQIISEDISKALSLKYPKYNYSNSIQTWKVKDSNIVLISKIQSLVEYKDTLICERKIKDRLNNRRNKQLELIKSL
jgi:hypothetical protein